MMMEETRFIGTIEHGDSSFPVSFGAAIDELGALKLTFDGCASDRDLLFLVASGKSGQPVPWLQLRGASADGIRFESDYFYTTGWSHGSELLLEGGCAMADIIRPIDADGGKDLRRWFVRQLQSFYPLRHNCDLGQVAIGGPQVDRDEQRPRGMIELVHPSGTGDAAWWDESETFLAHVARVLSFACGSYMLPVIDESFRDGHIRSRIHGRKAATPPYMPPFQFLHMEPIFKCACESYTFRDEISVLDSAIRWLTASAHYDEDRLIHAVSALENIIENALPDDKKKYLKGGNLKRMEKAVRQQLRDLGASDEQLKKVAELNRRSFQEKLEVLLEERHIAISDLPKDWLPLVISARNKIVHTGLAGDYSPPDIGERLMWAAEVVTRIILDRLRFQGGYWSWLDGHEQLRFPECQPMAEWAARQTYCH